MQANRIILGGLALLVTSLAGLAGLAAGRSLAQESPPAPTSEEHRWLATLAGEYRARMDGITGPSEGTSRIETALGGLWSIRHFESTVAGQPYQGIEILGYDPLKKKFVAVWADSMTPTLTNTEGSYDAETRTLTMHGTSRGMDGEKARMVNTTRFTDEGMAWAMNLEGESAPTVTIDYTRKE